ncbi:hypothetical protein MRX96_025263 [Rhipicephalus microplus]
MSVAFAQQQKGRHNPSPAQIQKMLDENSQLIQAIVDYQNKGKASECLQYQQILHRNLVYLASVADAGPMVQASIPPPCGPGVPDQGGSPATGGLMPGQQSYGPSMQSQQQAAPGSLQIELAVASAAFLFLKQFERAHDRLPKFAAPPPLP